MLSEALYTEPCAAELAAWQLLVVSAVRQACAQTSDRKSPVHAPQANAWMHKQHPSRSTARLNYVWPCAALSHHHSAHLAFFFAAVAARVHADVTFVPQTTFVAQQERWCVTAVQMPFTL
jgi:hypothetical protein